LSDGLLMAVSPAPLMDPYAVFQRLMDYWADVLQDDVYLVTSSGWEEAARLRLVSDGNGTKDASANVLTVGKQRFRSDLVPASLVAHRYFHDEHAAIALLEAEIEDLTGQMADLTEEHGGEGGLLDEVVGDAGKVSKPAIVARLKAIGHDAEFADERSQIVAYGDLLNALADAKARQKQAATVLTAKVVAQYRALSVEDVKTLVVEDKWLAHLKTGLEDEIHRVSRLLATRLTVLATRYASPIRDTMAEVADRWTRVSDHLERMGATWR
jgi:type I restriction enzyme M protein